MVYCTKQQEIYQESQRSDVATGNAGWPSQTQTQTQRCGALRRRLEGSEGETRKWDGEKHPEKSVWRVSICILEAATVLEVFYREGRTPNLGVHDLR